MTLQPNTVSIIECNLRAKGNKPVLGNYYGMNEPSNKLIQEGLFIANTLCVSESGHVLVKIVYLGDKPLKLYKRKKIGNFSKCIIPEISNMVSSKGDFPNKNSNNDCVDNNITELYDKLELDKIDLPAQDKLKLKALVKKHKEVFSKNKYDIGKCNFFRAKIDLKKDFVPQWAPSHSLNYKMKKEMDSQIENLLREGAIEECEYSLWNSPVFLVKKQGSGYRFVADMRRLNQECLLDNFELPNINKLLDDIGKAKIFSTLDITSSFNQIEYEEESRSLIAFFYKNKQYQFRRLVQGQKSSPAKFTRMISKLFSKIPFKHLIVFIDDFLIPTENVTEHLEHLDYVLGKLKEAGLKINPEKSKFLRSEVKFVGHIISGEGMRMDSHRLDPILTLEPPKTIKQTQALLGVLNYNRNYCENFARIVKPIYELLEKGNKFVWTEECQNSLNEIKKTLTEAPTLAFPDLEDDSSVFEVHTDSSKLGWGAVLYQTIKGERKIISYFSKATPKHRKRMGATKLEFLGLYHALLHWKHLLLGRFFKVYTDCLALIDLDKLFIKGDVIMQRKIEELAPFNMHITHISGTTNTFADFLSRYPFKNIQKNVATQTETIPESGIIRSGGHILNKKKENDGIIHKESILDSRKGISPENIQSATRRQSLLPICPVNIVTQTEIVQSQPSEDHPEFNKSFKDKSFSFVSRQDLIKCQGQDHILKEVISWVKKGTRPSHIQENMQPKELMSLYRQFKMLKFEKNILYRKWISRRNPEEHNWLIVVPLELQTKIMEYYHDSISLCHPGLEISLDRCRQKFYWQGMKEDFSLYIGSCIKCNQNKQCKQYLKAPLKCLIFHKFNAAVGIDHIILNNGKPTARGNTCILSITDMFSNYCILVNCKGQTSEETINHLIKEWVLKFGLFDQIFHDLHPGFTSKLFTKVLEVFQIKDTRTTPYRCFSNGRSEATNKRAGAALRAAIPRGDIKNWDKYTMFVNAALNSLKSSHTGFTPNF